MPVDLNTFDPLVIATDHPGLQVVGPLSPGMQKRVWQVTYQGADYVLKVYQNVPESRSRAEREIEILRRCTSPYLAQVGPLPLTTKVITPPDDAVVYYLEEFVAGTPVDQIAKPFSTPEVVKLGICITEAIEVLTANVLLRP
jgi:hypothetical protein